MKKPILILFIIRLTVMVQAQTVTNFEFNTDNWIFPEKYQIVEFQGKQSLLIERTADDAFKGYYATVKEFDFESGIIEFDLFCPQMEGSYVGFLFRLTTNEEEDRYELFYFCPFQTNEIGAVQYMPVNNGVINWPDYDHDVYKSDGDIPWNEWVHVKADINGPRATVYVNNQLVMMVPNLARGRSNGKIGLWLGNTPKCYYANFKVTLDPVISGITKDGKKVYASSIENYEETPVENAFDGDMTTRWSSVFKDPQWIMIDLGEIQKVGGVILKWEAAYARAYEIRVSTDSTEWTTVYSTTAGNGGTDEIGFDQIDTRFVMMYGTKRATLYGYSIYEFEVHENVSFVENEKLPDRFVILSSYPNPFNPATYIEYTLSQTSKVKLCVYDALGRQVSKLVNGIKPAGKHRILFDSQGLASGIYIALLKTNYSIKRHKMLLIK